MDLAIEHRPRRVFETVGGDYMELLIVFVVFGDDADDTARADIEREDAVAGALGGGWFFPGCFGGLAGLALAGSLFGSLGCFCCCCAGFLGGSSGGFIYGGHKKTPCIFRILKVIFIISRSI